MKMVVVTEADPKQLRTNIRYSDIRHLPPEVRAAMKQVAIDAQRARDEQGFWPHPKARFTLDMVITMPDKRVDLDGPLKRALDAMCRGADLMDSRIDEIHLYRAEIGPNRIEATFYTKGPYHDPVPPPPPDDGGEDWVIMPGQSFTVGARIEDESTSGERTGT